MVAPSLYKDKNELIAKRFQEIVDSLAHTLNAKSALITQLTDKALLIKSASTNPENDRKAGDSFPLNANLFCLKVTKTQSPLLIFDHQRHTVDTDTKASKLDYYGFPLFYPDGELYGTVCAMEARPEQTLSEIHNIFKSFIAIIERDFEYFSTQRNGDS